MSSASLPALQLMTSRALSFKVSGSEHSPSVLSKAGTGRAAIPRAETPCGFPPTLHHSSERTQNTCLPNTSSIGAEANEGRTIRQRLPWGTGKTAGAKRERHKGHSTAATTIATRQRRLARPWPSLTHVPASLISVTPQSA